MSQTIISYDSLYDDKKYKTVGETELTKLIEDHKDGTKYTIKINGYPVELTTNEILALGIEFIDIAATIDGIDLSDPKYMPHDKDSVLGKLHSLQLNIIEGYYK
jgi:hypothetical protein